MAFPENWRRGHREWSRKNSDIAVYYYGSEVSGGLSYDWSKVNAISVVGILPIMLIFLFF